MKKLKKKLEKKIAKYQKMLDVINRVHDDFVLPEKWCVLRTEENYKEINKWFEREENNKESWNFSNNNGYLTSSDINSENFMCGKLKKPKGYTEITFEQFKKYVSLL